MVNRQFQIVIADDDHDDQYFMQQAIKRSKISHKIISVYDGEELLELLHEDKEVTRQIDLIIMDINMPRITGIEALTKIRSEQQFEHIPIVIMSSLVDQAERENIISLGTNAFFKNPLDILELDNIFEEISTSVLHLSRKRSSLLE